jgi:hypothetical protein
VLGVAPWWWWSGGPYLPDLQVWQGAGGIPIVNFVGWAAVTFVVIFLFLLFFDGHGRRLDRLVDVTGLLCRLHAGPRAASRDVRYDPGS